MESVFDMWIYGKLPFEWQRKVDDFAGRGKFPDKKENEQVFRAGFFIGKNIAEIIQDLEEGGFQNENLCSRKNIRA